MQKKADRIAICIITVMMAMQLSLFKIFAKFIPIFNYSYNTPLLCALYVLMIGAVYVLVIGGRCRKRADTEDENEAVSEADEGSGNGSRLQMAAIVNTCRDIMKDNSCLSFELLTIILAIALTDAVTIINGQLRFTNILTHNLDYFYVFLALPIAILLKEEKWKFKDFADTLLLLTALSMVLRIFVMAYYGATGIEIECISRESSMEGWVRDGRIRVIPPCFIFISLPIAAYMCATVKGFLQKGLYALYGLLALFYVYFVWQSRMGLVYMAFGIGIMVMFGATSKKLNAARWIAAVLAGFAALLLGAGKLFMRLFSIDPSTAAYFGENRGHYYAYDIFWGHFRQNFLTGCGLNETLSLGVYTEVDTKRIWLTDAGILYSLEPMGILIGIFFLLIFARGIYVYLTGRKSDYMAILPLALTATVLVCEISIDCFFTPLAFSVPFYIAVVEYVAGRKGR